MTCAGICGTGKHVNWTDSTLSRNKHLLQFMGYLWRFWTDSTLSRNKQLLQFMAYSWRFRTDSTLSRNKQLLPVHGVSGRILLHCQEIINKFMAFWCFKALNQCFHTIYIFMIYYIYSQLSLTCSDVLLSFL